MTASSVRQGCYLAAAALGLGLTWYFNLTYTGTDSYVAAWFANSASSSAAVDLIILSAALSCFVVAEGRRLGMRHTWLFIPLGVVVAMALSVPLFLFARERTLTRASRKAPDTP